MRMLGIDPGLQATGWGLVRFSANRLYHEGHGIIRTTTKMSDAERLCAIADGLGDVIRDYQPENAMIEEIFVSQNPRSALRLGMARGVAIQVCGAAGLGAVRVQCAHERGWLAVYELRELLLEEAEVERAYANFVQH